MATKQASKKSNHPYSTPALSGVYREPPYEYRDSSTTVVQFETDAETLRILVPEPLKPNKDNHMFVSVTDFMSSGFGRYLEAHIFTHATFQKRVVNYSIYLILDNDVAICGGREIWGFPKKLGRLDMNMTDDVVIASAERGGIELIKIAVQMSEFAAPEELSGSTEWLTRKYIPSVSLNSPPDVDQLTSTVLTNINIREVYKGPATLDFGNSPADRLIDIPVNKVLGGYYYRADITLPDGVVAHNYLK
ncbi:MAG: acetoacetate decarboxylase [Gammaproteobacteria bacterium]|jgi:acetoacetate decarboxylase